MFVAEAVRGMDAAVGAPTEGFTASSATYSGVGSALERVSAILNPGPIDSLFLHCG